jgi:hypothetical protein
MHLLAQQRCFNHATREAAARCPECQHFFCRECVTEHDDRVLCAACLKRLAPQALARRIGFAQILGLGQCALGLLVAWYIFFLAGLGLSKLPDSFHEGTLWQAHWIDQK